MANKGWPGPHSSQEKAARNKALLEAFWKGTPVAELLRLYKISRARVYQLVHARLHARPGD